MKSLLTLFLFCFSLFLCTEFSFAQEITDDDLNISAGLSSIDESSDSASTDSTTSGDLLDSSNPDAHNLELKDPTDLTDDPSKPKPSKKANSGIIFN